MGQALQGNTVMREIVGSTREAGAVRLVAAAISRAELARPRSTLRPTLSGLTCLVVGGT